MLQRFEDKLLFMLVYQKTNPLQTMHALQFDLSQPQANDWMHQLLPVLQHALAALGMAPNVTQAVSPPVLPCWKARQRQRLTGPNAAGNVPQTPSGTRSIAAVRKDAYG